MCEVGGEGCRRGLAHELVHDNNLAAASFGPRATSALDRHSHLLRHHHPRDVGPIIMADPRIARIEWGQLEGHRPRHAGCNARLGEHGIVVRPAVARITTDDGATGWGASRITRKQAANLIGSRLSDVFIVGQGASRTGLPLEFPLWDLAGKRAGAPVYALAGNDGRGHAGEALSRPLL